MLKIIWSAMLLCIISTGNVQSAQAGDQKGETLYTQVNIYSLKGKLVTWVNYHVDTLIPVNTAVIVNSTRGSRVTFTIKKTDQKLKLRNRERHSGLDGKAWAAKHFGKHKVDLSRFTQVERDAIANAQVKVGMSKQAVIVARGYPPAHKTPNLESNQWFYWYNRWNKKAVLFSADGKVSRIRD